jgi:hypothetical protein
MMIAAGSNNAFAINGFTGLTTAQIFSFFMVFILFNGYVVLEAVALAAFYVTSKPRHGHVRTAAMWHFAAGVLVMVAFVTTVWAAPAEKTFVDASRNDVSLNQPPNIVVGSFPVTRAEMLFVGIGVAGIAVLCMLIGFIRGAAQKRTIREEVYAAA